MERSLQSHFDDLYLEDHARYGVDPLLIVQAAVGHLSPESAILDCAGGQGRNALYAAEQGHWVILVDLSPVAVAQVRDEVMRRGISSLCAVQGDVMRDGIQGDYDLIICAFVLHYYSKSVGRDFLKEMRKHTIVGGYNAIAVIMTGGDFYEADPHISDHWYFASGELKSIYEADGWRIGCNLELVGTSPAKKEDGSFMRNKNAFITARKSYETMSR